VVPSVLVGVVLGMTRLALVRCDKSRPVAGSSVEALNRDGYTNGKEVDQGVARKAQQEPEGEMEGTETAAAAEAP
jgi:hypothetical protein